MSRSSALATALVVLPAVRAAIDAVEAVIDLADRFGLSGLATSRCVGEWELDAEFSATRFGLGVLVDHQPAASPTHGDLTTAGLLIGPLRFSATRSRLASELLDCTLAGPLPDRFDLPSGAANWAEFGLVTPFGDECPWHRAPCTGLDHENHDPSMPLGARA